ncbi:MaoC family dehydratase [Hyalangium minutum]|uniref:Acyl dehydratase n=1 Tax=Hyalangium minutum TaxID=394096 RepID=A0A085WFI0_9BACT|nr:MaoC family dehydratase [Hyalangium minutum]KFE66443.1 Acyl dehydratase [Hyalangium minutum]
MPARKLYFEAIRVGDELPALAKAPVDRVQLSRYAGASGDYNPVHVDEVYAKSVGMPSVYAPGMLIMGMLGQLISDWARGGQLRRYNVRFIKMVWPGDTVVCKGRVSDRHGSGGRYFVDIDLWAENQRGELLMKGQSVIQLFYSLEDENRQRAGQAPIVVEVPRESILDQQSGGQAEGSEAEETGSKKAPSTAKKSAKTATATPAPLSPPANGNGAAAAAKKVKK